MIRLFHFFVYFIFFSFLLLLLIYLLFCLAHFIVRHSSRSVFLSLPFSYSSIQFLNTDCTIFLALFTVHIHSSLIDSLLSSLSRFYSSVFFFTVARANTWTCSYKHLHILSASLQTSEQPAQPRTRRPIDFYGVSKFSMPSFFSET